MLGYQYYEKLVRFLYKPTDPSCLGIVRFLFGLLMLADLPEERGGSDVDLRWGDSRDCHFPLFPLMKPLHYPYMALLYGVMWFGALGIMLGFHFKLSIFLFGIPYWYILLLDKTYWNNHSYLYGIVTVLLMGSSANHFFSLDGLLDRNIRNRHVPKWNYLILKFQFFLLYFMAGLKKTDMEWLEGYSMNHLADHWVFNPFKIVLTNDQIDYLIVHWFGFLLDLTIGFWLLIDFTRPIALIFCASFHLMNSRLFSIGMFPYVCLATLPIFCEENWPRKLLRLKSNPGPSESCIYPPKALKKINDLRLSSEINWKHKFVTGLLLTHCGLQCFLPYSHFITKGYNNWTQGLYGYSWDMMVHSWDTILVIVKVVDNQSGQEHFLEPSAFSQNERWAKHADMCIQYAHCLKNNLLQDLTKMDSQNVQNDPGNTKLQYITSENISIYIDVWCSLNGRFQQRMYDPNYDLLQANWSPFKPVEWLKPLLTQYSNLRQQIQDISKEVYSWSNYTDVLFVADFPGLYLENYISDDLRNVTLTILQGEVYYVNEDDMSDKSFGVKLKTGESIEVEMGVFHKIHTTSAIPSCFMYIYVNRTKELLGEEATEIDIDMYSPFPLVEDIENRMDSFLRMVAHVSGSFLHVLYDVPLFKRSRIPIRDK